MDEIKSQSSVCTDENSTGNDLTTNLDRRICLVGKLVHDTSLRTVAESFGYPVITSQTGQEYVHDDSCTTIFVLENFEGDVYTSLYKLKQPLLGPPALQELANKKRDLPKNTRPLYNLSMTGVVVCFTGFRNKEELIKLVPLIHHMGGSIRKEVCVKVTHLIANTAGGGKYQYASTFRVPVMNYEWVFASWERRHDSSFVATLDVFMAEYKLKPFHGIKVCFVGFPQEEEKHMTEVLLSNGGTVTNLEDPNCSYVVVDESAITEKPDVGIRVHVVKAEWFWTSVQKETCLEEKEYLFDDYVDQGLSPIARRDSHAATPSSGARRKRKRMHEAISAFVHQSPSLHKRRSSVSDAGLLSVSGSFLDCTTSPDKAILDGGEPVPETPRKGLTPRHQVFLELLQTESNYVDILHTIVNMFKKHLEEMPEEEALLNNTELNLIFGKLPLIYETHVKMLEALRKMNSNWSEEHSIGQIIVDYSKDLSKAYPPYINYFEEVKDQLIRYDQTKPRFHAFLKACQTKPECGRQNLQDLMIRPVQRLGSISLLLNDILKNTAKSNPDHSKLELALNEIRNVLQQINEDKRKTEGQVILFNIFNEIDNCPPDIVSSHRSLITKAEVVQVSSEGLSSKGNNLMLFLFSDQLEVCKKKSKAFNSLKSPSSINNLQTRPVVKSYKHVKLIPLSTIKKVIDIKETEDCQRVFSLICRNLDEGKDRLYTFAMVDEDADKSSFIKLFTKQMATHSCTADSDKFLGFLEPHQLDIDTTDLLGNGTLSKAFKFATRTKLKVGRAFSFNKTPSKLKRAVSSMMSPFGSSTNLTPASQLAQMRLASCNNLSMRKNSDAYYMLYLSNLY